MKRTIPFDKLNQDILIANILKEHINNKKIVVINVGTDKVIFDSFGPILGQLLKERNYNHIITYGSLEYTLNATNLEKDFKIIKEKHANDFIIATDACLIGENSIFNIDDLSFKLCGVDPGKGLCRELPSIGSMTILYNTDYAYNSKFDYITSNAKGIGSVYKKCRQVLEFFDNIEKEIDIYIRSCENEYEKSKKVFEQNI